MSYVHNMKYGAIHKWFYQVFVTFWPLPPKYHIFSLQFVIKISSICDSSPQKDDDVIYGRLLIILLHFVLLCTQLFTLLSYEMLSHLTFTNDEFGEFSKDIIGSQDLRISDLKYFCELSELQVIIMASSFSSFYQENRSHSSPNIH